MHPTAQLDGPVREVKLLTEHRRHLVVERTNWSAGCAGICMSVDPTLGVPPRGLRRYRVIDDLAQRLPLQPVFSPSNRCPWRE